MSSPDQNINNATTFSVAYSTEAEAEEEAVQWAHENGNSLYIVLEAKSVAGEEPAEHLRQLQNHNCEYKGEQ